ncbi:MAG: hypothetical protein M1833_006657 [Piccolia ochrophora]|nr:MAG: hypothetical protein M1833_006657 [Piccolia ochrophora]
MPDIRNFFGGGSQSFASSQDKAAKKDDQKSGVLKRKRTAARKVIDDSEDEDFEPTNKKTTPKRPTPQKKAKKESPKGESVTTSDYFQSTSKGRTTRSTPTKAKPPPAKKENVAAASATPTKAKAGATKAKATPPVKPATNGRSSSRKKKTTSYAEVGDDDVTFLDDDEDAGDDIFTSDFKKGAKAGKDEYTEDEDSDDIKPRTTARGSKKQKSLRKDEDEAVDDDYVDIRDIEPEEEIVPPDKDEKVVKDKQVNGKKSSSRNKRKAATADDSADDDDFSTLEPSTKNATTAKASPKKPPPKKQRTQAKKAEIEESKEIQDIFESIPTVKPPSPPPKSGEPHKFDFKSQAQRSAPPPGAGTKDIPTGQENCLAGLTFVFTGLLDTLSRDDGINLVKRYGGHITTAPSRKTSYVVLGNDAGPKKLEVIQKNGIKTINEDGLFQLIRKLPANGGDSKAAAAHEDKKAKEQEKIKQMAAEMEKEDRRLGGGGGASAPTGSGRQRPTANGKSTVDSRLWTTKYAPTMTNQICGNKGQVEKLQRWLREWPKNHRLQFKKAGADGSFAYRAVIIHGPPGIGKTTAAHLVAKLEGYDVLESNASDTRSKKLVETGLKSVLDNTSLLGYFAGDHKSVDAAKKKIVLIMDEVDGMSAGDRGGVGALAQVCKKTNIPMILICNERRIPKMKPFDFVTFDVPFRRPTTTDIRSRIASICYREGLKLPPPVMDALIEGTGADIRQVINMISTVKLDQQNMSFDDSKSMSKAWEKHIILKPWDIAHKLLSSAMFAATSNKTLNDKIELYFNDHEFSYLMLQENYLKTKMSGANNYSGREYNLKTLELADKAAESISDGDLVDRMIHGPQQQWSLMPTHAVFSTVRPASFVNGSMGGSASFTSWLGNNSKYGKLTRYVKEIQGHMRLRASGDRHEIRQQYLPALWSELVRKLQVEGKDAVGDVIKLMDDYFLTREDFDAIMELGVGPMDMEHVKIDTQSKATFTRLYNQQSHPLPFMKSSSVVAPKKAAKEKPDLEEAIEESDEGEDPNVDKDVKEEEEEDVDLSKDKYVKQPKKKKAPAKKAAPKPKAKAVEDDEGLDDDSEDEEDVKPTKGRNAKGKAPAKKQKAKR